MKKLLFVVFALFALSVRADNTITSKEYVAGQVSNLQEQIPAKNTNTVLTNTGTAGTIGEKAIYDTTAAFGAQSDALVTAGAFNSAIQNALESEFVCIEWQGSVHDNAHCLLYEVRAATQTQTLPSGYTQLEYIESTGTQYLNLGQPIGSGENITVKFEYTVGTPGVWFGARDDNSLSAGFVFDYAIDADTLFIISHNVARTAYYGYLFNTLSFSTPYILNWHGNPFRSPNLVPNETVGKTGNIDESNYLITPPYNAFLFAYNRGGVVYGRKPMRIYYFTVEGKMKLIPALRNSDDKLGMYDLITGTFFANSGTGEFVAGPVVNSNLYLPSGN